MAVIGHQAIADLSQRIFGVSRSSARVLMGGRKLTAKSAIFCVEIVLVAILGVLLGVIFLSIFAPLPLPESNIVAAAPAEQGGPQPVKSPFPATTLAASPLNSAPTVTETTLDLTLTGIWSHLDGGSATIRTPDGDEKRFAVGDTIVQGVTLAAVYADQVTLDRGGVREALRFESKNTLEAKAAPVRALNERPLSLTPAGMGKLASVLSLAPSMDADGNFAIEIHAARDRRTFAAVGLKNGDRLLSVNGISAPGNPAGLAKMLSELQQSDTATLMVERDGKEQRIFFKMDQLGVD